MLDFLPVSPSKEKIGLIAGNGRFPFLVLDAARSQGHEVIVAAIKEETFPQIESHGAAAVHWLSLGELSKLIETFKKEGIRRAIMAGQVKHTKLFADIVPDFTLMGDYQLPRTAGFALKKNEPGFLDFVNGTLLKLEASGEAAKIFDAWFAPVPRTFHIQPD